MENDLFQADQPTKETLRQQLTTKWKEKFPTADDELIKSKVDSDIYVKMLERQKDELRADYIKAQEEIQKGKALETLIDRLNNRDIQQPTTPQKAPENTPPSLGKDDIEKLIQDRYEQNKRIEIETRNFNDVQAKLRDRYGSNAGEILREQSDTLGLSKEEVNALAKKSPEAFFRVMGLNNQGQDLFMAPPRSDVRNDNFAPKTQKRTWNFYQDMKRKDPTKYWDPKTQLQMHRDAESLGNAFEDGDFN